MTEQINNFSNDIIYINHVIIKDIKQIEATDKKIYVLKDNSIYIFNIDDFFYQKKEIQIHPKDGQIIFIYPLGEQIFAVIKENDANFLYIVANAELKKIGHFDLRNINGYAIYGEEYAVLYSMDKIKDNNNLLLLDKYGNSCIITIGIDYENANCATIFEQEIYVALHNPNQIIKIELNSIIEDISKGKSSPQFSNVFNQACYNFLCDGDRLLFASDGPTIVKDKSGCTVFEDVKEKQSGYQISAVGTLQLKRNYQLLGTWRRNEEHPLSCLYVLRDCKEIYKTTQDTIDGTKIKPWTGFNSYCKNRQGKIIVFKYNDNEAVIIRGFENNTLFASKITGKNLLLVHNDDCVSIYDDNVGLQIAHVAQSEQKAFPYITPSEPLNLYITIDVEQHIKGVPYCITGEGLGTPCGVYYIMDILDKNGLKGVFFVNIYEHINYDGLIEKLLNDIEARGHEIGLHCHASSLQFNKNPISEYDYSGQKKIIQYGIDFIKKHTGKKPFSFRSGGYNLNDNTLLALNELGIKLDSSVFLCVPQDIKYKSKNSLAFYGNMAELPVTCLMSNNMTTKIDINWSGNAQKMLQQINICHNYGLKNVVMMLHSFSFLDFTKDSGEAVVPFTFTAKRHIKGVKKNLMREFEKFCATVASHPAIRVKTFIQAGEEGFLDINSAPGADNIPVLPLAAIQKHICPICGNAVEFEPYRGRKNALCPKCHSLERMRFKMHYLKKSVNIENCDSLKILHFGPALIIQKYLSSLPQHDYISSDPYNEAFFKFPIENIPFENNRFDLLICVGVLMHVLDDYKAISEMRRVLKTGGILLLWLGSLAAEKTVESYDRKDFTRMEVGDMSYPKDLGAVVTQEKNGKILYNPRFRTRIYGKDFLDRLHNEGFDIKLIRASEYMDCLKYGVLPDDLLVSCIKR